MPFQVWARGASAQCSTLFTIRTHTRTHILLYYAHTYAHSCIYVYSHTWAYTLAEAFVILSLIPHTLYCIATICLPVCKIAETLPSNPRLTVIQSSLRVQDLTHTVWESCTTLNPHRPSHHRTPMNNSHCSALSVCGLFSLWFSSSSSLGLSCRHVLGPLYCFFISFPCGVTDCIVTRFIFGGSHAHARRRAQCSPSSLSTEEVMRFKALSLSLD